MPGNPPLGSCVRCQSPTPPGVSWSTSWNGDCSYAPGAQRKRLVQCVAETDVDVPGAVRVRIVREIANGEDEMIRHLLAGRALGAVHAADVSNHVVSERAQQLAERTVEVEAVAATVLPRHALKGIGGVDAPRFAELDPERLVGHSFGMRRDGAGTTRRPSTARRRGRVGQGSAARAASTSEVTMRTGQVRACQRSLASSKRRRVRVDVARAFLVGVEVPLRTRGR